MIIYQKNYKGKFLMLILIMIKLTFSIFKGVICVKEMSINVHKFIKKMNKNQMK